MSSISPGPPCPTPSFILKNVTVDDTDSSLKYSSGWNRSVSSFAVGGAFQSTDRIGEVVSFSLPANAVAVYYFGFEQSSGALYEACLDCTIKASNDIDVIDAHSTETRSSEPKVLYQKTNLDPSVRHSLALLNVPDSRFGNASTITVDSFVVTVEDEAPSASCTSSSITSTSTSMVSMSSMGGISLMAMDPSSDIENVPSPTPPPGVQAVPPSTVSFSPSAASESASANGHVQNQGDLSAGERFAQKARTPLVLTGVILGTLFIVCTALYALMYFMRRRRRRKAAPVMMEGHWAARFFLEKGRGEGRHEGKGVGAEAGMGTVKVAKGAMIEQFIPDQPTYASLPSRPTPSPPSATQGNEQQWVAPTYHTYNAMQAPGRTIPRSAFPYPLAGPSRPPVQTQQLARAPSAGPFSLPSRTPSPGLGPGPGQSPKMHVEPPAVENPYVAEARARVRDRARELANGDLNGPGQASGYGLNTPYGPATGYAYGRSGHERGLQRNDSGGSQYSS